jgi:hypothetical protein
MRIGKETVRESLIFASIVTLSGIVAILIGKDWNGDLRNYHYYNGFAFLHGRLDFDVAPAQIQTYLNPLPDLFVYLGITYLPPMAFGFCLGAVQGTGLWLVYKLARCITNRLPEKTSIWLPLLAALTALCGAGWLSELGNTMGDSIVSIFVLAALLLTVTGATSPGSRGIGALLGAGFLLGFGTGLKLIVAVYAIGYLVALFFLIKQGDRLKISLIILVSLSGGLLASSGFWMLTLWQKFKNPLFPFFNAYFGSPHAEHINFSDGRFFPVTPAEKLFYPFHFLFDPNRVSERQFLDFRICILYLTILFCIGSIVYYKFRPQEDSNSRTAPYTGTDIFLIVFCAVAYLVWQIKFSIYRYLMPVEMLTPVMVLLVITRVPAIAHRRVGITCSILGFLIVSGLVKPLDWGRQPWQMGEPWGGDYFNLIATASLSKYENKTVLMLGDRPTAYVIPFFPESTRFVRTLTIGADTDKNTGVNREVSRLLRSSREMYVLLMDGKEINESAFKISQAPDPCDSFATAPHHVFWICRATLAE